MELLIRETVGQVLNMKALFRDVNEALQRSITNLRIKKMGILFLKWPSLRSWRYYVGARLKFWWRSRVPKNGSRDKAVEIPPTRKPRYFE